MTATFIPSWLTNERLKGVTNVIILREKTDNRSLAKSALADTLLDHYVGADVIDQIGGYPLAAQAIKNALPTAKRIRSGDFGEVMATEYVDQTTPFSVPVRRLRYKDDRNMAMRGDDLLAFRFDVTPPHVLKAEAKSRAKLSAAVVGQASDSLCKLEGRPNPSTLSFISRRLREGAEHKKAAIIERLQESDIPLATIKHLIFTVSANDPGLYLQQHAASPIVGVSRLLMGCIIPDHTDFIHDLYETALKGAEASGDH